MVGLSPQGTPCARSLPRLVIDAEAADQLHTLDTVRRALEPFEPIPESGVWHHLNP